MSLRTLTANLKLALAGLLLAGGIGLAAPAPAAAQASGDAKAAVCEGVNQASGDCSGNGSEITTVIRLAIQILSLIAGIAAVIMIIIAGLKYITSGGDSSQIASAKTSLIYAIVGLVVVALAQIIVRYVLGEAGA